MKKTIIFITGLLTFAILATACTTPTADDQESTQTAVIQEQLDSTTVIEAIESKNKDLCNTVENEELKNDCLIKVDDRIILDEVRESGEIEKCSEIQQESTKEKCEIIANEKIEKMKEAEIIEKENTERDLQLAEDERALEEITQGEIPTAEDCEVIKDPEYKAGCLIQAGQLP